jgi:hypothetical protein
MNLKNNLPPQPPVDPNSRSGREMLLEWRMARIEATLANFTRALWSLGVIVIGALIVFYLTAKGAEAP